MIVQLEPKDLNRYGNVPVTLDARLAPVSTQRRLKLSRVEKWYSDGELQELKKTKHRTKDNQFTGPFKEALAEAKLDNKMFKFTELEDMFIRNNYQYLTDTVIALALNLPCSRVTQRRLALGLYKEQQPKDDVLVIVWDNRDKMDKDLKTLEAEGLVLLRENLR